MMNLKEPMPIISPVYVLDSTKGESVLQGMLRSLMLQDVQMSNEFKKFKLVDLV